MQELAHFLEITLSYLRAQLLLQCKFSSVLTSYVFAFKISVQIKSFNDISQKIAVLIGVTSLEIGAAKRKRAKPNSIWDFVAESQDPIESINMIERNISVQFLWSN